MSIETENKLERRFSNRKFEIWPKMIFQPSLENLTRFPCFSIKVSFGSVWNLSLNELGQKSDQKIPSRDEYCCYLVKALVSWWRKILSPELTNFTITWINIQTFWRGEICENISNSKVWCKDCLTISENRCLRSIKELNDATFNFLDEKGPKIRIRKCRRAGLTVRCEIEKGLRRSPQKVLPCTQFTMTSTYLREYIYILAGILYFYGF